MHAMLDNALPWTASDSPNDTGSVGDGEHLNDVGTM